MERTFIWFGITMVLLCIAIPALALHHQFRYSNEITYVNIEDITNQNNTVTFDLTEADRQRTEEQLKKDAEVFYYNRIVDDRSTTEYILFYSELYRVSPHLMFALISVESEFNHKAVNRANSNGSVDYGLCQLNSNSYPDLTEKDFFDKQTNIETGVIHLATELAYYGGDKYRALAAYNAGRSRVNNNDIPDSTKEYIAKISAKYGEFYNGYSIYMQNLQNVPERSVRIVYR